MEDLKSSMCFCWCGCSARISDLSRPIGSLSGPGGSVKPSIVWGGANQSMGEDPNVAVVHDISLFVSWQRRVHQ